MRTHRLFPVLIAVCALATGAVPGAQAQKPTMEGYPVLGAPPIVTLVTPGSAPRKQLRYAIPAAQKSRLEMAMAMAMTMNMAGMPVPMNLPVMRMSIDLAVTSVAPNGDITYDLEFTGVTVDGSAGDPIAAAMQTAAAGVTGIKGTATVTSRGVTKAARIATESVTDPQVKQIFAQMASSVENLSMPFPEDAVGPGARWEVRQTVSANGLVLFQKSEFELVSVDGPTVTLKVKTEQTAPAQPISNPGLPEGTETSLEKLSGTGSGTVVIRLDSLVPTSELDSTTSTVMTINMGGQTQSVSVDGTMKLTIKAGK